MTNDSTERPVDPDITKQTVDRNTPALALSGGGFRATLFHAGALMRLNELGWLTKVTRISSVSGGSITSGALAAAWPRLTFANGVITNFLEAVVRPLQEFCARSIDTMAIGWGAFLPGITIGDMLAKAYDDLFAGITLQDLPDTPQFVFNATNLQTGRLVRFQKVRLADYTIGIIPNPKIRVALAVAASSAFPPVLSPVEITVHPQDWKDPGDAIHFGDPAYTGQLSLIDGGAYDNLGLETINDFATMIVSDAGAPFSVGEETGAFWPKQAMRALDIATNQSRSLRKRMLFTERADKKRVAVYSGIDSNPDEYSAPQKIRVDPAVTAALARMRTRLNPFSPEEQGKLLNWGWLMMDVAARSYIAKEIPAPETLPFPEYPLH